MLEMDGIWCYEVIIFANFIALWTTINLSSFAARVFPFSFLFFLLFFPILLESFPQVSIILLYEIQQLCNTESNSEIL